MVQRKRLLLLPLGVFVVLVLYLLFWPVSINPGSWTPSQSPSLTGRYQQNSKLASTERLPIGEGFAPEDVAVDAQNRIYAGLDDGRIVRLQPDGTRPEDFAHTQGRPLGFSFDSAGNLIVADAVKGLLSISTDGVVSVLTTEVNGSAFRCTNDLDIARDGTIYFTDASRKFPLTNYRADIVEHRPNGRLLAYDPGTKSTRVVLDNLRFANGVAVSPDQSFVIVAETGRYRLHRVWLNGPKQGQAELFIENLPGFPDGLSSNGSDRFWVALVSPRNALLDRLLPHPFLRKAVLRLPRMFQPAPKRYSFVIGLNSEGEVVENLQDGSPNCFSQIANVVEHNGVLYFGSIGEAAIGRYRLR
jgi:sugar lactone lactonase YvrE